MTKYFIFRASYPEGRRINGTGQITLATYNNKRMVNPGDRFLLYLKDKGIMVTGFTIKEIDDSKPFASKISLLPSLVSNFRPEGLPLAGRKRIFEITEESYNHLKEELERNKVSSYEDLMDRAQAKGERFQRKVLQFFKEMFEPLSGSTEVNWKARYLDRYETEVLIKFNGYDILVDAFTNKSEFGRKVDRFIKINQKVVEEKRAFIRFLLFYEGNEEELPRDKGDIPENMVVLVLGKRAYEYYSWLMDTTPLKKNGGKASGISAFHMLGELGIADINASFEASPYLRLNDGSNILYVFKKDVNDIVPILYVARRERGGEKKYYQRLLNKKKLLGEEGSIDDYLTPEEGGSSHTTFLNSIVISPEEIKEDEDANKISIPLRYGSVAILDGQHRVYGAYLNSLKLGKLNELYFTAIVDKEKKILPMEQQQEYFVSINKEQTKVDPENIWRSYGELGYYKNKPKGIVSRVATKLEKEKVLVIKKQQFRGGGTKGLSFAGLCRSTESFAKEINLFNTAKGSELSPSQASNLVTDIFRRVRVMVNATGQMSPGMKGEFLGEDGLMAILFRLYTNITKVCGMNPNQVTVQTYFKALSASFDEDKQLMGKIETSGEGPRNAAAEMLVQVINRNLLPGNKSLTTSRVIEKTPVVDRIADKLDKLSKTYIKGENNQKKPYISPTGGWFTYALDLGKPVTSPELFNKNIVDTLYKILHEGGNFPEEFKEKEIMKSIGSLRTYSDHDIHHGDKNEIQKKKNRAEDAVKRYIGLAKLPNELSAPQLEELKGKLLEDVVAFLDELYKYAMEK